MSKLPLNQDAPDEFELEAEAVTALQSGFLQLDTPPSDVHIETTVIQALTSGVDFDPLHRQITRRIVWTAIPTVAAFLLATAVLALRPIPRVPLTHWLASHGEGFLVQATPAIADEIYRPRAPLPELSESEDGFHTRVRGLNVPAWYRKPTIMATPKSANSNLKSKIKGMVHL